MDARSNSFDSDDINTNLPDLSNSILMNVYSMLDGKKIFYDISKIFSHWLTTSIVERE